MKQPNRIINVLQTPRLLITVIKNINRQKKFIEENILPYLQAAKEINDGSTDDKDFKKITGYYGLAVPAILGEAFYALRGGKMTAKERLTSTCQGAITGLGDDFFDKKNISNKGLKNFIEHPHQFTGDTSFEKLFLNFFKTALANAPNRQWMQHRLAQVFNAQVQSKKQSALGLNYEAIKDITLNKGGVSLLFYRSAFDKPIDIKEEKMLYCLGGLMQICNDIFDIYEDHQHGVNTLLTTAKNITDIRRIFLALMNIGFDAAYKTNYPKRNIKKFINIISIGIFSRSLVCLHQLEKNEARSNNIFSPEKYKRKDLVCDMDTALNKWRSVKYHIRYAV